MSKRVILVPRRADNGHRDGLWKYCKDFWGNLGLEIVEGDHLEGPFNRSAAVNAAAKNAGEWDTALVIDSDILVDPHNVHHAISLAETTGRQVFPFRDYHALNNKGAELVMAGNKGNWKPYIRASYRDNRSACFVIPRTTWDQVGGFDERFIGWGFEDVAFAFACNQAAGNYLRLAGDLWHLWHPISAENNHNSPRYLANRDLCARYAELFTWDDMKALLSEKGGPLS
jgi:hypothetical protein